MASNGEPSRAEEASFTSEDVEHGHVDSEDMDDEDESSRGRPTLSELQRMPSGTRELYLSGLLEEQLRLLEEFDQHSLERDVMALADASLTFKDVAFSVETPSDEDPYQKVRKSILEPCSGHFAAGSMVALMGPSGCGKTTLLDILAKRKTSRYEGSIYVNGREVDDLYPRIRAYVDSSDSAMPPHWTVKEAVAFNLLLKAPVQVEVRHRKACRHLMKKRIDVTLQMMGLLSVANAKIGGPSVRGISTGQRRRVTLARGLQCNAHLMFVDEPTSGLSSTDAELCVKTLRIMSKKWNVTTIVVIHQPRNEVARLFDHLLLLTSRPGRVVYNGPMADAASYWANAGFPVPLEVTPTDYFLDVVTPGAPRARPDLFVKQYAVVQLPLTVAAVEKSLATPGQDAMDLLWTREEMWQRILRRPVHKKPARSVFSVGIGLQVAVLMHRRVKLMLVDPTMLMMQLLSPLLIGLFEGAICNYDVAGKGAVAEFQFLTVVLMTTIFLGLPTVPNLFEDRAIMEAEVSEALYSEWAHIIVTSCIGMVLTIVRSTLYGAVMYAFALLPWSNYPLYYAWTTLLAVSLDPLFAAAAALATDTQSAMLCAMFGLIFLLISSGTAFATTVTAPYLEPVFFVSPTFRVAEQLVPALYGHQPETVDFIHKYIGLGSSPVWVAILACTSFFFVFILLQTVLLLTMKQQAK